MISKARYYEKRIHKLNKRLARIKNKSGKYTDPNGMMEIVVNKINSYNKAIKGKE